MRPSDSWLFSFEKWYFDLTADDGTLLFAYVAPMRLFGRRSMELVFWLLPAGGEPLTRSFHLGGREVSGAGQPTRLSFPGGELSLTEADCHLMVGLDELQLRLEYERLDTSWLPGRDGTLLGRGSRQLSWQVPLPRGRARARGCIGSQKIELDGFGYADYVATTILPWRVPLRRLLWGRAVSEELCLIWEQPRFARTRERRRVTRGFLREGDREAQLLDVVETEVDRWEMEPKTGGFYPVDLRLRLSPSAGSDGETVEVELRETRLLLAETVADLQSFSNRLEQQLYRKLTGDPITYKLMSRMTVGDSPAIWAAHELVLWGAETKRRHQPPPPGVY